MVGDFESVEILQLMDLGGWKGGQTDSKFCPACHPRFSAL